MRVLYVVGSCLTKNTSANMSHNAFVEGLLENGCEVDIIMPKDSWGQQDSRLPVWNQAQYYCYPSTSFQDWLRVRARNLIPAERPKEITEKRDIKKSTTCQSSKKAMLRSWMKKIFYFIFPNDSCYPLSRTWLKKALHFYSKTEYDLVLSNSSPAASHKLVQLLLEKKRISCKRWIQIWEDPWYADVYDQRNPEIFQEERQLLNAASEVYYVSPLTLEYQKRLFPDSAGKMKHIPLPYLEFAKDFNVESGRSFGYFGDYYSHTRNLMPFYEALRQSGCCGYIYGDSDLNLPSTEQIEVRGRVTLDVLEKIQAQTGILVHLCNLKGGQIPGKIYHYSATDKPILFILDGTDDERRKIKNYFSQFHRYYFVDNQKDSIYAAIENIQRDYDRVAGKKVKLFEPKYVIACLLSEKIK